ncbi:5-hydroxyisourate hydrolase-like isoform X3 [Narcine bancroftii]|uniref:5-hydroxyisourate hydrolase-like isoform X3 n=1 Tax=Narcine bancroftii TaxID=1343680 RepID=UPI0038314C71
MTAPRLQHIQHHLVARKCNCQERNMSESVLTTHILNTTQGIPAARLAVCVSRLENEQWKEMARGVTNSDGRCPGLFTSQTFTPGIYKMKFATNEYWQSLKIVFNVSDTSQKYHIALLMNPFSYTTYRGS